MNCLRRRLRWRSQRERQGAAQKYCWWLWCWRWLRWWVEVVEVGVGTWTVSDADSGGVRNGSVKGLHKSIAGGCDVGGGWDGGLKWWKWGWAHELSQMQGGELEVVRVRGGSCALERVACREGFWGVQQPVKPNSVVLWSGAFRFYFPILKK